MTQRYHPAVSAGPLEIQPCERLSGAVEVLGKRWTLLIVALLLQRSARFCELSRALPELSERVMSARLRELAEAGVVSRRVDPGPPIVATYRLTAHGARLRPVIEALGVWADEA